MNVASKKSLKALKARLGTLLSYTILIGFFLMLAAPVGLFYRGFWVLNNTGEDILITMHSSDRGTPNSKAYLLGLYYDALSVVPFNMVNYPLKSNQAIELGFNMDDEYPSWITVTNLQGKELPVDIQFDGNCLLIISNGQVLPSSGSTNVEEDDIGCSPRDYAFKLAEKHRIVQVNPNWVTELD